MLACLARRCVSIMRENNIGESMSIRSRRLARGGLFGLIWLSGHVNAAIDPTLIPFHIDKQPMSQALNSLALQANCQMFFEDSAVAALTAPRVMGLMSTADALHRLLAHTVLEYSQEAGGVIVVRRKPAAVTAATAPKRRKPIVTLAQAAPAPAAVEPQSLPVAAAPVEGPWMVGARGIYLDPANRPGTDASDRWLPEFDLEYFFDSHWSTELAFDLPRNSALSITNSHGGHSGATGRLTELPAYLLVKYNFLPDARWRPYIGTGVNVISRYQVDAGPYSLSSTSLGPAAQVGVQVRLGGSWFLDADAKWAWSRPDLRVDGAAASTINMDRWTYGIGAAYRFGGSR